MHEAFVLLVLEVIVLMRINEQVSLRVASFRGDLNKNCVVMPR